MLTTIHKFASIDYPFPEAQIFSRLGHRTGTTVTSGPTQERVQHWLSRAQAVCRPQAVTGTLPVTENNAQGVLLGDGTRLASTNLGRFLSQASQVWLVCITLGPELPALVRTALDSGDGAGALIVDATGSECVDAALDTLQQFARRDFLRQGLFLDQRRFSAGYGDWPLSGQQHFFSWFPLAEMGLRLSSGFTIEPEKTITAIAGISREDTYDPQ